MSSTLHPKRFVQHWPIKNRRRKIQPRYSSANSLVMHQFLFLPAKATCRTQTTKMFVLSIDNILYDRIEQWHIYFLFSQFGCAIPILYFSIALRRCIRFLKGVFFLLLFPSLFNIFNFVGIVWFYFILRGITYALLMLPLLLFFWTFFFILK